MPQCPHSPPATTLGSELPRDTLGWRVLEFCWLEEPGKALYCSPLILPFYDGVQVVFAGHI